MRKICPIFFFLITACSSLSVNEALDRVKPGMDKAEVLDLADGPKHSYHEKSQDHWIYEYYNDGTMMTRHLVFENGHVVSVGPVRQKNSKSVETAADADDDMEHFEKEVKEQQKKHQGEFKEIKSE